MNPYENNPELKKLFRGNFVIINQQEHKVQYENNMKIFNPLTKVKIDTTEKELIGMILTEKDYNLHVINELKQIVPELFF